MKRLALVLLCTCHAALATPLGTALTYQGQLIESGQPANGLYDLQACVFDGPATVAPLGCVADLADVPVAGGLFSAELDFGSAIFNGEQRWLELRVRPGASSGGYTALLPRQLVRAAPEALRASAASAAPWSGLSGVPAGFADGTDDVGAGTVSSVTAGAGLAGGTITDSGTVSIADGGVSGAMIAAGAVGTTQLAANAVDSVSIADAAVVAADIAPGAVGAAQIDPTQVQARVSGSCAAGTYVSAVNADGSAQCSALPGPADYVRNTNSVQVGAGFNVDGNGIIGGRLGIGTPAPDAALHLKSSAIGYEAGLMLEEPVSGDRSLFYFVRDRGAVILNNRFSDGRSLPLVLNPGGKVVIGFPPGFVPQSQHTLGIADGPFWTSNAWIGEIELTNAGAIGWAANGSGQHFGIGQSGGGLFFFRTSAATGTTGSPATYDMNINDAGNVGIGTITPASKLTVAGRIETTQGVILRSPNGAVCRVLAIDNAGTFTANAIACP
jgi:hypothetical protein